MDESKVRQIVQEEMRRNEGSSRFQLKEIPFHKHDGIDSINIKQSDILPSVSVGGNIRFAHTGMFNIFLNSSFTPSNVMLYGNAVNRGGSITFTLSSSATASTGTIYKQGSNRFTVLSTIAGSLTLSTSGGTRGDPTASGTLTLFAGSGDTTINYTSVSSSDSITVRCQVIGSANLGPSFYLQPGGTNNNVVTGNIQYPNVWNKTDDSASVVETPMQSSSYIWVQSPNTFKALSGDGGYIVDVSAGTTIYARMRVVSFSKSLVTIEVTNLQTGWEINANLIIT